MRKATIEKMIVEVLKDAFKGSLGVERFPSRPDKYEFIHPKAVILVRYNGKVPSKPVGNSNTGLQIGLMEWEIIIIARNLRADHNNEGIYEILDEISETLIATNIQGHGYFYQTMEDFISEDKGIWTYGMKFMLPFKMMRGVKEKDPE